MLRDAGEYEARAAECERLAFATLDMVLRDEILSLCRAYRGYAEHLRQRSVTVEWLEAVS